MFIDTARPSDCAPAERDVSGPLSHSAPLEPELTSDWVNIWSLRDRACFTNTVPTRSPPGAECILSVGDERTKLRSAVTSSRYPPIFRKCPSTQE